MQKPNKYKITPYDVEKLRTNQISWWITGWIPTLFVYFGKGVDEYVMNYLRSVFPGLDIVIGPYMKQCVQIVRGVVTIKMGAQMKQVLNDWLNKWLDDPQNRLESLKNLRLEAAAYQSEEDALNSEPCCSCFPFWCKSSTLSSDDQKRLYLERQALDEAFDNVERHLKQEIKVKQEIKEHKQHNKSGYTLMVI